MVLFGLHFGSSALIGTGILKVGIFIVLTPLIGAFSGILNVGPNNVIHKKKHPMKVEKNFRCYSYFLMLFILDMEAMMLKRQWNNCSPTFSVAGSIFYC